MVNAKAVTREPLYPVQAHIASRGAHALRTTPSMRTAVKRHASQITITSQKYPAQDGLFACCPAALAQPIRQQGLKINGLVRSFRLMSAWNSGCGQ
jgi:hypothetical protein